MKIEKTVCVGAGLIGQGWATLFAWRGYSATLQDKSKEALENALSAINRNLNFLVEKGLMKNDRLESSIERIGITTSLEEAVKESDYIQESVFESYEVKKEVFRQIDATASSDAVLASSTSTLKISILQKVTKHPERCVVAHPWNPPHLMPLVEIIPGKKTSTETVKRARGFMEKLGKVPVLQRKEVSGSIGNRLAAALWREAIDLVDKGIADLEDVDRVVSLGPGLRWAVLGPHLSYHLGGGTGGIEHYLEHLGPSMESRWKTLASWTSLTPSVKKKMFNGIKQSRVVREKSVEDLIKWRDDKLVKILKVLYEQNDL